MCVSNRNDDLISPLLPIMKLSERHYESLYFSLDKSLPTTGSCEWIMLRPSEQYHISRYSLWNVSDS